jgi:hypothetical protein
LNEKIENQAERLELGALDAAVKKRGEIIEWLRRIRSCQFGLAKIEGCDTTIESFK